MSHVRRSLVATGAALAVGLTGLAAGPVQGASGHPARVPTHGRYNVKTPTSVGYGGAVTSVDPEASRVGLEVLRRGGNAVDAAVATAAALGVTEPYSSGIGGGGYFVYYDARTHQVGTIDGRETAPRACRTTPSSTRRPASRYNFRPSWSPAASRSACPARWPPGTGRCSAGARAASAQRSAPGEPARRRAASSSTRPSTSRPAQNQARFAAVPRAPRALFLPGGQRAGGRLGAAQPRPGRDLPASSRRRASAPSTDGPLGRARSPAPRSTRRSAPARTLPVPAG